MAENLRLFEKKKAWTRVPGALGGSCGSRHVHESGWKVIHCGHPTANFPYYVEGPDEKLYFAPNSRAFRRLKLAKETAELLAKEEGHG